MKIYHVKRKDNGARIYDITVDAVVIAENEDNAFEILFRDCCNWDSNNINSNITEIGVANNNERERLVLENYKPG